MQHRNRFARLTGWIVRLAVLLSIALPQTVLGSDEGASEKTGKKSVRAQKPEQLQAVFTDGSTLKLTVLDKQLKFKTRYGELKIPFADIQRIEFATRIPDKLAKQIESEVANLGNSEYKTRESATAKLQKLGEKAVPAILRATTHENAEIAMRAKGLLAKLRETVKKELIDGRHYDVVYTRESKISGRIDADSLKVNTVQFAEQRVKLPDLRSLKSATAAEEVVAKNVMPDPGSLRAYGAHVKKDFFFKVTVRPMAGPFGALGGALWGTEKYTLDSTLALAAVHAGVLKVGETGVVRVTILAPQVAFAGSIRNGVASNGYGPYPGAYQVRKVGR